MDFKFSFSFDTIAYTYLNCVNFYYNHHYLSTVQFTNVNNEGKTITYEKFKDSNNIERYNICDGKLQKYNILPESEFIPVEVKEFLNLINIKQMFYGRVDEVFTDNIVLLR